MYQIKILEDRFGIISIFSVNLRSSKCLIVILFICRNLMKYSIIIPVYNSETFLNKCLDSVLNQSFDDFEAIIIDDGSSDNSLQICEKYAKKDNRLRVFHQENRGVSAARNFGLKEAEGEYIVFLDSDDYISEHYLEEFSKYDSDCIIRGYSRFGDLRSEFMPNLTHYNGKTSVKNYIKNKFGGFESRGILSKAIKRDIVQKNNIQFDEKLRFGEDTIFFMQCYFKCNSIVEIPYAGYFNYVVKGQVEKYNLRVKDYKYFLDQVSSLFVKNKFGLNNTQSWIMLKEMFYSFLIINIWDSSFKQSFKECIKYVFSTASDYMPYHKKSIRIKKGIGILTIPWQILLKRN